MKWLFKHLSGKADELYVIKKLTDKVRLFSWIQNILFCNISFIISKYLLYNLRCIDKDVTLIKSHFGMSIFFLTLMVCVYSYFVIINQISYIRY